MIALVLVVSISGVIGMRVGGALEEKRFRSSVERLFSELESCRRLALSGQADWLVLLEKKKDYFVLHKSCPELGKESEASWKSSCKVRFNGKPANALSFQFTSSGKVSPAGKLVIEDKKRSVVWQMPDQFAIFERGRV